MKDSTVIPIFFALIIITYVFIENWGTILPNVGDCEYWVDKYGVIHDEYCEYKKKPWFTQRYNKYEFLLETNQDLCNECTYDEIDILKKLHYYNLDRRLFYLQLSGADKDYQEKFKCKHRWTIDENLWYED
jgi:hypothetical protein